MKLSHYIALIVVIVMAWASLFITVLSQSNKTNQILSTDHKLLSQDTTILNAQKQTESNLEMKIADLQGHVDCLFNLATQSSGSHIADANACTITAPINSPAPPANRAPKPARTSVTAPPRTTSLPQTKSKHTPTKVAKPPVCKLSFGLIGC